MPALPYQALVTASVTYAISFGVIQGPETGIRSMLSPSRTSATAQHGQTYGAKLPRPGKPDGKFVDVVPIIRFFTALAAHRRIKHARGQVVGTGEVFHGHYVKEPP